MLVISRRKHQSISIGDDIEIIVSEVHRSSVKLAVRAPRHLTVLRSEIVNDYEPGTTGDAPASPQWTVRGGCLVALEAGAKIELGALADMLAKL